MHESEAHVEIEPCDGSQIESMLKLPLSRRAAFALALAAGAAAVIDPEVSLALAYDQWVTCYRSDVGGYTELSQYWVESKIYPNRGRKVWVRLVLSTGVSGYILDWQTYEDFYDNGNWVCQIPPNWSSVRGPGTVYNPQNGSGVSFMIYGGGDHQITKHSTAFRPGAVTGNDFRFTISLPFIISASASAGGSISSAGDSIINPGGSKSYTVTPSTGYKLKSLVVDGSSKGAISSYTFSNVRSDHVIRAEFDLITFTVTFKSGYGENATLKTETVAYGRDATAPTPPSRPGWKFSGWDKGFTKVTSNLVVTAKWAPDAKVRYFADGELMHTQTGLTPGSVVSVPSEALQKCKRPGCTPGWHGWYTDAACTKPWAGGSVPAGTLDLYSWNELTLSFALVDGSDETDGVFKSSPDLSSSDVQLLPDTRTVKYNQTLSLSLPPTCFKSEGDGHWLTYRPKGYYTTSSGSGSVVSKVSPKSDMTLYVSWKAAAVDGVESLS